MLNIGLVVGTTSSKFECLRLFVRGGVVESVLEKPRAQRLSCFLGPPPVSPANI